MAELTISPDEIRDALDKFVSEFHPDVAATDEVGTVVASGDGIARVEGLPSAMANELLEFSNGTLGIALNLDVREIGVVVLGESEGIEEGSIVKRTGEVLSVPVGDGYLGRVVDAMGNPIDGLGELKGVTEHRALELQAAGVMDRQSVNEPLQTGIKAIDSMTPIGRGQRQLIIGDRKTGKTAVCDRRHPEPEGQLGHSGDVEQAGALHLRCHRSEGFHHRGRCTRLPSRRSRRDGIHHHRCTAPASDSGRLQVASHRTPARPSASTGCMPGQARSGRIRRPDQAGRGLPFDVAAAAPSAGP